MARKHLQWVIKHAEKRKYIQSDKPQDYIQAAEALLKKTRKAEKMKSDLSWRCLADQLLPIIQCSENPELLSVCHRSQWIAPKPTPAP